jgi:hypothetical protein
MSAAAARTRAGPLGECAAEATAARKSLRVQENFVIRDVPYTSSAHGGSLMSA